VTRVVVCNPGRTPVALNAAGGQLGGGEYGVADSKDPVAANRIAGGSLVVIERKVPDDHPAAAAFAALRGKTPAVADEPEGEGES